MPLYNGTHIADRARMKKILTLFDPYIGLMMIMIACAAVFPVRGEGAAIAATTADVAIAFLFFLSGTRLSPKAAVAGRSEEHTSELQSLMRPSYAVFCLKQKN